MQRKWLFLLVGALALTSWIDARAEAKSEAASSQQALQRPVVLPEGTVLEIRLTESISTRKNKTGDRFEAVLEKDLVVDGQILVPKKSRVTGTLLEVRGAGRIKGRARMSLTLTEIEVGPAQHGIQTNHIEIEAEGTKGKDAKKIGGAATVGAIVGVITGGGGGAALGTIIGAGSGTGGVLVTKGKEVSLERSKSSAFAWKRTPHYHKNAVAL